MSLKAFHVVFVAACMLFAMGFAVWAWLQYRESGAAVDLAYAISGAVVCLILAGYGRWFLRKLKNFSYV